MLVAAIIMIDNAIGITIGSSWEKLRFGALHAANADIVSADMPITTSTDIKIVKSHMKLAMIFFTLVVMIRLYLNGNATWMNRSMLIGMNMSLAAINAAIIGICISLQSTSMLKPVR